MKQLPFFSTAQTKTDMGKIAIVNSELYRYLLGEMSPPERDALEDRYFQDNALHEEILAAEDDLIDAHVAGKLTKQQNARFKDFFLRSEERVQKLRLAEALTQQGKPNSKWSLALTLSGAAFIVVLLIVASVRVNYGRAAYPSISFEMAKKPGMIQRAGDTVGHWLSGLVPATLQHEFKGGVLTAAAGWTDQTLDAGFDGIGDPRDWIGKTNKTASLRLWKKSAGMANYRMEFQGQLESTSLSWAVRASDSKNFYGTRLAIIKAGPLMNAGLIRFTMIDGKEVDRTLFPLPLRLERGTNYRVTVTAQGDQISTYINGAFIGRLTDRRFPRGGVGFFDDATDPQKIAWVTLSESDSVLGKMFSHFALFVRPASS